MHAWLFGCFAAVLLSACFVYLIYIHVVLMGLSLARRANILSEQQDTKKCLKRVKKSTGRPWKYTKCAIAQTHINAVLCKHSNKQGCLHLYTQTDPFKDLTSFLSIKHKRLLLYTGKWSHSDTMTVPWISSYSWHTDNSRLKCAPETQK